MKRACRHCGREFDVLRSDKSYCNHICRRNWYRARIPALALLAPIEDGRAVETADQPSETGRTAHSAPVSV